jgi:DNA replication protein
MKWYEQNFVNRRDWVLDHLELLGLDANETILVLLIDFFNDHRIPVTMEILHKKSGLTMEQVDETISALCARRYLEIRASARKVRFILDGLYSTDTAKSERILDSSLFDTFETEFGRPLSNQEMMRISEWNRTTDKTLILYALRQASAYRKLSVNYIDKILSEWKTEGKTAEMIEKENAA